MAYSEIVKTQLRNPETGVWSNGPDVLFTQNSISDCSETDGKTLVACSSGRAYYVNKTLAQIETFLNS